MVCRTAPATRTAWESAGDSWLTATATSPPEPLHCSARARQRIRCPAPTCPPVSARTKRGGHDIVKMARP
jgi:hypothetical protein